MQEGPARFGFKQAAGVAALYTIASGVCALAIDKLLRHFLGVSAAVGMLLGLAASFLLATALVIWREKSLHRVSSLRREELRVPLRPLFSWALVVVGVAVLMSEVDNRFRAVWPPPEFIVETFKMLSLAENPVLVIAAGVIIGPVAEELVMRGIVLRGLLGTMSIARAVLLSAVLFSLMHANPWQALPTFCMGLVWGWAYARTGSLGLCIVAHIANNAMAAASPMIANWLPGFGGLAANSAIEFQPGWFTAAGALMFAGGMFCFARATGGSATAAARPKPVGVAE